MAAEKIEIWLGYGTSEKQGRDIRAVFEEQGIPVEVRLESAFPQEGNGAGFTILVGLFGMTVAGFLNGYLHAAGEDAWKKSKDLLRNLKADHHKRYPSEPPSAEGLVAFKDVKRRIQINLQSDLPEVAREKLSELVISDQEEVSYSWNEERQEWEVFDLSGIEDRSALTRDHPDVED